MSGCAGGLDKKATVVDWSKGSVIVLSVEMDNQYRPSYPATRLGVVITRQTSNDPRQQIRALSNSPVSPKVFLVTSQLQPGTYSVSGILGSSHSGLITGIFEFGVNAPFEIAPNSITYLGRLSTVNKQKVNKDDQSTGAVIPLLDQAVTGFANGTLEVALKDNYEEDVKLLKNEFAYLQNIDVVHRPLQRMTLERATGSSAGLIELKSEAKAADTGSADVPQSSSVTK